MAITPEQQLKLDKADELVKILARTFEAIYEHARDEDLQYRNAIMDYVRITLTQLVTMICCTMRCEDFNPKSVMSLLTPINHNLKEVINTLKEFAEETHIPDAAILEHVRLLTICDPATGDILPIPVKDPLFYAQLINSPEK
jgi:hypothetical protein